MLNVFVVLEDVQQLCGSKWLWTIETIKLLQLALFAESYVHRIGTIVFGWHLLLLSILQMHEKTNKQIVVCSSPLERNANTMICKTIRRWRFEMQQVVSIRQCSIRCILIKFFLVSRAPRASCLTETVYEIIDASKLSSAFVIDNSVYKEQICPRRR